MAFMEFFSIVLSTASSTSSSSAVLVVVAISSPWPFLTTDSTPVVRPSLPRALFNATWLQRVPASDSAVEGLHRGGMERPQPNVAGYARAALLCASLSLVQVVVVLVAIATVGAVRRWRSSVRRKRGIQGGTTLMVVLGSGGHTAEMLRVLKFFDMKRYRPRIYVLSNTDSHSAKRARAFEEAHQGANAGREEAWGDVAYPVVIPRSREVGQSYFTSIFTTLYAIMVSFSTVVRARPNLVSTSSCVHARSSSFGFPIKQWLN